MSMNMKRTILSLLVAGLCAGIGTSAIAEDAAAQTDRLELELVADVGHFIVDEKPELVADRLLRLLP